MPNYNTERWRVQSHDGFRVTHESSFADPERARGYYDVLSTGEVTLQVRRAGERRFRVVDRKGPGVADDVLPPCAQSMGCLCAGHARENPADTACDTRERSTTPPRGNLTRFCNRHGVYGDGCPPSPPDYYPGENR